MQNEPQLTPQAYGASSVWRAIAGSAGVVLMFAAIFLPSGVIVGYRIGTGLLLFWPVPIAIMGLVPSWTATSSDSASRASRMANHWFRSAWIYGITGSVVAFFAIDERLGLLSHQNLLFVLLCWIWLFWLLIAIAISTCLGISALVSEVRKPGKLGDTAWIPVFLNLYSGLAWVTIWAYSSS